MIVYLQFASNYLLKGEKYLWEIQLIPLEKT